MASRKYRPIVMNRNKKPAKTYTILKKVLLVTAILAFIEVVILVVIHFKNGSKETSKAGDKTDEITNQVAKDTFSVSNKKLGKVVAESKPSQTGAKKDNIDKRKMNAENIQSAAKGSDSDSSDLSFGTTKKVEEVSEEKMVEILNEIRHEKTDDSNVARCVTIKIVNRSNARNGNKIARFLMKNGLIISGREVVKGTQNGIKIISTGPCVQLSIGAL
jgi:hypothetical protein